MFMELFIISNKKTKYVRGSLVIELTSNIFKKSDIGE